MKQSKTVLLGEAIASLWDDDPDMYEQLLVHRLRDYLPELLGPMYRQRKINGHLGAELVRFIQIY